MAIRDYRYDTKYESSATQKHRRAIRNRDRRRALAAGKVRKGGSLDVHHRDGTRLKNPTVMPRSKNRGIK